MAGNENVPFYLKSIKETLAGIDALVSLPEIYVKFRQLMEDPESSNEDFSKLISCDPNLAATVLKFVNSPIYGLSEEVSTISRAIHFIGINRLHALILAASAMALDYPNDIVPLKVFWRSSLFSGVLTRMLAEHLGWDDSESLFIIGLLHQLGQLVIYSKHPEQAKKAMFSAKEDNLPIDRAQQQVLGFHYGQVGAKLMVQWRLPVNFSIITYFQPTPLDAPANRLETALLHLVHGYAQEYIDQEIDRKELIRPEVWSLLNLEPDRVDAIFAQAAEVSAGMENAILK